MTDQNKLAKAEAIADTFLFPGGIRTTHWFTAKKAALAALHYDKDGLSESACAVDCPQQEGVTHEDVLNLVREHLAEVGEDPFVVQRDSDGTWATRTVAALAALSEPSEQAPVDENLADWIAEARIHAGDMPAVIQRDYLFAALDKLALYTQPTLAAQAVTLDGEKAVAAFLGWATFEYAQRYANPGEADKYLRFAEIIRIAAEARMTEKLVRLEKAGREVADKLWVLRCNSRDELDRKAAESACDMWTTALRDGGQP